MTDPGTILGSIIEWARTEKPIRCLLLIGSRASRTGKLDSLSDFDVVLYVDDVEAFVRREEWVEWWAPVFLRYRENRTSEEGKVAGDLVLYADDTKIDYTVQPTATLRRIVEAGELPDALDAGYRVLVDKDGLAGTLPEPTGGAYVPAPPTRQEYTALVEEFWWESFYVARNLVREELLPAKYSLDCVMKLQLLRRLLEWQAGVATGWSVPAGALGRGLARHLDPEVWSELEATYVGADMEANWKALFATARLFGRVARSVGSTLGFDYPDTLEESALGKLSELRG